MDRVEAIRQLINEALSPTQLDIVDESHFHKGHPGAASGAGHFNVSVVSETYGDVLAASKELADI